MNCHFDLKPRLLRLERRSLRPAQRAIAASDKLQVSPLRDDTAVAPVEMTRLREVQRQGKGTRKAQMLIMRCIRATKEVVARASIFVLFAFPAHAAEAPREVSRADFARDLVQLQDVVRRCGAAGSACGETIVSDEKVSAEGPAPAFTERWDWLRAALEKSAKAPEMERHALMEEASAHLVELNAETNGALDPAAKARSEATYAAASAKATEILNRPAFQHADGPTWWQRQLARLSMWLGSLFEGVSRLGEAAPWLGTLLEWTFFLLAAAGLLLFIRRSFVRQQMQVALNQTSGQLGTWDREASDWASDAETHAAAHEWREAVHCLYWAAIVRLEARRAWRHNPARTPREYVRLLKAGSPQQLALRGLTGIFERVWYGLRQADSADYGRARDLFDHLVSNAADTAPAPVLVAEAAR